MIGEEKDMNEEEKIISNEEEGPKQKPPATAYVENTQIVMHNKHNKHTRAAIEALAMAAEENAKAIAAIARGLERSAGHAVGIAIGGGN